MGVYVLIMKNDFSDTREARFAALSTKKGMERFQRIAEEFTREATKSKESAI